MSDVTDGRCTEDVRDSARWPSYHKCGRKSVAVDEKGNPRCGIHSPAAVAARHKKASERYERQMAQVSAPYKRAEAAERQRDALADLLRQTAPLVGGWRELIAEWDDHAKSEAVGKAMWAALDQIDRFKAKARSLLAEIDGAAVPAEREA